MPDGQQITVKTPDGGTAIFPTGTSEADILKAMNAQFGEKSYSSPADAVVHGASSDEILKASQKEAAPQITMKPLGTAWGGNESIDQKIARMSPAQVERMHEGGSMAIPFNLALGPVLGRALAGGSLLSKAIRGAGIGAATTGIPEAIYSGDLGRSAKSAAIGAGTGAVLAPLMEVSPAITRYVRGLPMRLGGLMPETTAEAEARVEQEMGRAITAEERAKIKSAADLERLREQDAKARMARGNESAAQAAEQEAKMQPLGRPSDLEQRVTQAVQARVITPDQYNLLERELGPQGLMKNEASELGTVRASRAARGMRDRAPLSDPFAVQSALPKPRSLGAAATEPEIEIGEPHRNLSSPENPISMEALGARRQYRVVNDAGHVIRDRISEDAVEHGRLPRNQHVEYREPTTGKWIPY